MLSESADARIPIPDAPAVRWLSTPPGACALVARTLALVCWPEGSDWHWQAQTGDGDVLQAWHGCRDIEEATGLAAMYALGWMDGQKAKAAKKSRKKVRAKA